MTPVLGMSQFISGQVLRRVCGEKIPVAGAQVFIDHPGPLGGHVFTDDNGYWSYLILESDPEGTYKIDLVEFSGTIPPYYLIDQGDPKNTNMNFIVNGLDIQTPLYIVDCYDGEPAPMALDSDEPTVFAACGEETLPLVYWDVMGELGLDGEGCDLESFPGCARLLIYEATAEGEISPEPIQESEWISAVDCRDLCAPSMVGIIAEPDLEDGYYLFELQYGCCDSREGPVILDTQRGLVHYVSEPEAVDVEFKFLASNMVDILNGNDDPTDGVEETSDIGPGPELGPLTIGIDADIIDGNFLESITYMIEEVECNGFGQPILLFEKTIPASDGVQPANFFFLDHFFDTSTDQPYFYVDANTIDKCFRTTITVSNVCGEVSKSSYFTITETCQFCRPQEGQPAFQTWESEVNNNPTSNDIQLNVYPNPFKQDTQLEIILTIPAPVSLRIRNLSGQVIRSWLFDLEEGIHSFPLSLAEIPSGMYFVEWTAGKYAGLLKLIKE
ncbi:MAG: T9SS type A sorting domain-containing protein [Lewinellaceae bacterium]|nr:T9SS type A sorting domain-containing protein [Lewinellaceae bacterium]